MPSEFTGFFVTEEQYLEHLRTKKPVNSGSVEPYLKISIYREFDVYSSYCRLSHNSNHMMNYLMEHDIRKYTVIQEYLEKGKPFYVTPNGVRFYRVLDIRVDTNKYLEIAIQMITTSIYTEKDHFFMVMPFGEEYLNNFYDNQVRSFLKTRLGVSIYRADDFNHNDVIIDTIYREIEKSEIIICDITLPNKNVFYEIGYAKAKDKELIFLMQQGTNHQFFDVAHIQRIEYDLNNPAPMQERLVDTIQHIRGKR
jgi:hypothetical protein